MATQLAHAVFGLAASPLVALGRQGLAPLVVGTRTHGGVLEQLVFQYGRVQLLQNGRSRDLGKDELIATLHGGPAFELDGRAISVRGIRQVVEPGRLAAVVDRRRRVGVTLSDLSGSDTVLRALRGRGTIELGQRREGDRHETLEISSDGVRVTSRAMGIKRGQPAWWWGNPLHVTADTADYYGTRGPEFERDGVPLTAERIDRLVRDAMSAAAATP